MLAEQSADPARLTSLASLSRVTLLGGGTGVGGGSPQQDQQIAGAALAALAGSG
jgi:uncharacterized protein GlcG (DUF336 family)